MALTPSTMAPLGMRAPDFRLPDTEGMLVSLADLAGAPALLVAFISNHCPYVQHIRSAFAKLARDFQAKGAAVVAIGSNDADSYPDDNPAGLKKQAQTLGFRFPYLFDENQAVAKAYHAACTPDFFLFDKDFKLVYRGEFDSSRPGSSTPVTGESLRGAIDAVLAGKTPDEDQRPSIGCNIKWKE